MKLIENLDGMDEMDFGAYFGSGGRTWSCTLSDGTVVPLKPDGENIPVLFEERHEYGQAVIETRMQESSDQVCSFNLKKSWFPRSRSLRDMVIYTIRLFSV